MKFNASNKMQISIFILISVMVIFLLFFLVNVNIGDKQREIEKNKDIVYSDSSSKGIMLKDNIDYCLEKELKKAVIIAGTRGGFVYKKDDERYLPGVLPIGIYPNTFLSNLDLTSSYLSERALVYTSQSDVHIPSLENSSNSNFNHSVKEDMERFIFNEFLKCIDINSMKEKGYDVVMDEFSGNVESNFGFGDIIVNGKIGKVNDTVKLDVGDKIYLGKIVSVDNVLKKTKVKFDDTSLIISSSYETVNVINMNTSSKVNVIFQDEAVIAKLDFPITVSKGGFETSVKNSEVSVNVRFKELLKLSESISNYKYYNNHSFDITNSSSIEKYINGDIGNGVPYFKDAEKKNLQIIKTSINDSDEYKAEVYTILDYDSKILGEPYVYNFGYENHAPVMDYSFLSNSVMEEDNKLVLTVSRNSPITFNLREVTKDPEFIDNLPWNKGYNHYYFKPIHYSGSDARFDLYENGTLRFVGYVEKIYAYEVLVTDGETKSRYIFKFVVGLPDNTNNLAAKNCFKFEPFQTEEFPIDDSLKGIFNYADSSGKEKLYGFTNYINYGATNLRGDSKIKFSSSCVFDPSTYSARYSINGGSKISLFAPYEIRLSSEINTAQNIEVEVVSSSGTLVTESYKITIYPASCLGPGVNNYEIKSIRDVGGFGSGLGTCCDIGVVKNAITSNTPTAFTGSNSNMISSGVVADPEMYFTFDLNSNLGSVDFENSLIWKQSTPEITSLYSGKLIANCQGSYPRYNENILRVDSSSPSIVGNIKAYSFSNFQKSFGSGPYPQINLKLEKSTAMCEFIEFNAKSSLAVLMNYGGREIPLATALKPRDGSSGYNSGPIPSSRDYNNLFVLCNNNWFGSTDALTWISSGNVGLGGNQGNVYKSKGYCYQGITTCSGRVNSPYYELVSDSASSCEDNYMNLPSGSIAQNSAPNTWICGSYNSCSGVCSAGCGGGPPNLISNNIWCSGSSLGCPAYSSVSSCTACIAQISVPIVPTPKTGPTTKLVCP